MESTKLRIKSLFNYFFLGVPIGNEIQSPKKAPKIDSILHLEVEPEINNQINNLLRKSASLS